LRCAGSSKKLALRKKFNNLRCARSSWAWHSTEKFALRKKLRSGTLLKQTGAAQESQESAAQEAQESACVITTFLPFIVSEMAAFISKSIQLVILIKIL